MSPEHPDRPDGPEHPDRPEPTDGMTGQDAAWQDIVAHFGDRAELAPDDLDPDASDPRADVRRPIPRPADDPDQWVPEDDPGDHYVPPPPPPLPRPTGARLLGWLGLFGSPTVMLVCLLVGVTIPSWGGVLLFVAFLGGFGYLVATMRKHDDSDPWDDGAVV
jgi:hypothetical protein